MFSLGVLSLRTNPSLLIFPQPSIDFWPKDGINHWYDKVYSGGLEMVEWAVIRKNLTHWGQDEKGAILQMTFQVHFLEWKYIDFDLNITKFIPKGLINNIPVLVQIMVRCRTGDKPLSGLMMIILLLHICVTRPQWVNSWIGVRLLKILAIFGHLTIENVFKISNGQKTFN